MCIPEGVSSSLTQRLVTVLGKALNSRTITATPIHLTSPSLTISIAQTQNYT
jgi:hypothetical protein